MFLGKRQKAREREERLRIETIGEKFINMYVSNFPDDWTEEPLKEILGRFVGTVYNVMIPRKKAKDGKRFAFVRFEKARDVEALIWRTRGVWIGLNKLFANVARFDNQYGGGRGRVYDGRIMEKLCSVLNRMTAAGLEVKSVIK